MKHSNLSKSPSILKYCTNKLLILLFLTILPRADLEARDLGSVTYAGINLDMSLGDRLASLKNQAFNCVTREHVPYLGHWHCTKNDANVIFDSKEILLDCTAISYCSKNLEEIALSIIADHDIPKMDQTVFYPPIGKERWYCGESEPRDVRVCVHQLVSINHEMVEIERNRGNPETIDFQLSKRHTHVHIKRLKAATPSQYLHLKKGDHQAVAFQFEDQDKP